ncbi:MAG: STAS domain-containing protein [Planctomycetaceae bacterium]|nr:STAS domain-containing protein [Planctomycetaceae bacterium]
MAEIKYDLERKQNALVLTLAGSLDASNAPPLSSAMEKELQDTALKDVVWDVRDLRLMASSGLRVIMTAIKICMPRGGKFYLARPNQEIARILRLAGMDKFVTLVDSPEACCGG